MTTAAALFLALLSITGLVIALGLAIVGGRSVRSLSAARRVRKTEQVRPILLAMLAEEDQEAAQDALAQLLALDGRMWSALEPTVTQLLGKLRGSSHDLLRTLVELRGTVGRARSRTHRLGAVRRARAAEILGSLEDPAVTADLVRLLSDRDPEVRQVAARALGRSGDARAAGALLASIFAGAVPPRVVSQALLRLGAGAEPALVRALDADNDMIRAISVEILGLSSAVSASRAVQLCLVADASLEVRIRAARSLGRVGLPSALEALIHATDIEEPTPLRAVAARALGELGHAGAVPRLRQLLRDPVHRVASNAGRALAGLGPLGEAALASETASQDQGTGAAHARDALSRAHVRRLWTASLTTVDPGTPAPRADREPALLPAAPGS